MNMLTMSVVFGQQGLDTSKVIDVAGYVIYAFLGLLALWGATCVILLLRRIAKKRFKNDEQSTAFMDKIRGALKDANFEDVGNTCNTPQFWERAVPQLIMVAMDNRKEGLVKIKQLVASKFEREILAELEYRLSWVNTVAKTAPMMGLLGTVVGMIGAFGKIAGADKVEASALAGDIGVALLTTALGLIVAIPNVLSSALITVRMRKLEDSVQDGMQQFLADFEQSQNEKRSSSRSSRS